MRALRKDDGFSLVEIMVVMAIMGLMASAVVLSMPSGDDRLERALDGTRTYMSALSRTSVSTGRVLGLRFDEHGYTPLVLEAGTWKPDGALVGRGKAWADTTLVSVELDGARIDTAQKKGEALRPHIWFLPTGEVAAFKLSLMVDDRLGTVVSVGGHDFKVVADES
ncbi:prepilin-type N-terminal cleavage/methylation domain-containing protein [Kordiimonas aestuarii]|uniref:prepilin-type N-terminal cleavage/methylation domain-containing protein n=1 Tax=Kordiimonas aestuarii TaxID=1005925 RepID=UPI0021CE5E19|nr:prepilin-type N-terminal cleavage/methylation domain-containing protein [Kordiimonas aestuarii]